MRKSNLILLIIFSTMTCFGQSLFFDNINNSTWKSGADYNDSTIRASKQIGLTKVYHSTDSLQVNVTIWTFKDEFLVVKHYDYRLKKDSLIVRYKYKVNAEKGILILTFNDKKSIEYEVGITSSGSFVLLSALCNLQKSAKSNW